MPQSGQSSAPIAVIGAGFVFALPLAVRAPASPDGAEWETAGTPEGCQRCHLDAPVIAESEGLSIAGLPKRPAAGHRYELTIVLEDAALMNAGFLLSIEPGGAASGELMAADGRTEIAGALARSNYDGSTPAAAGKASWRLVWTAPAAAEGPLRFDLWANAGNWDLSPLGDRIHHRSWQIEVSP